MLLKIVVTPPISLPIESFSPPLSFSQTNVTAQLNGILAVLLVSNVRDRNPLVSPGSQIQYPLCPSLPVKISLNGKQEILLIPYLAAGRYYR